MNQIETNETTGTIDKIKSNCLKKISKKQKNSKTEWTKKQDEFLLFLIDNFGCKWKFISKYYPEKSIFQLNTRYLRINPYFKRSRFTSEEDQKLKELVKIYGFRWAKIAAIFKDRNPKQLRTRYTNYLSKNYDESESTEEERRIIRLNYPLLRNKLGEYAKLLNKKRSPAFLRKVIFS